MAGRDKIIIRGARVNNLKNINVDIPRDKLVADFIFVVKNFKENPFHNVYQDPIEKLNFKRVENMIKQINWNTSV